MSRVVVLDLDGTLINTEQLVDETVGAVILDLDPSLAPSRVHDVLEKVRGTRPLDASRAVARELELPITGEALLERTSPLLNARWG